VEGSRRWGSRLWGADQEGAGSSGRAEKQVVGIARGCWCSQHIQLTRVALRAEYLAGRLAQVLSHVADH
jgi:hypothetical protein